MGDDHDRGEPSDLIPDAAFRVCAVLPAGGRAQGGDDRAYLSRGVAVRAHSGGGAGDPVVLPGYRDDPSGADGELRGVRLAWSQHQIEEPARNQGRSPPRIAVPPPGAAIWLQPALRSILFRTWLA